MLNIFRKHAATIALVIVVFFVGTMFTGAVLFGQFDPGELNPSRQIDEQNTVAYNNYIDLPLEVYNEMLQRLASQIPESVLRFNPELIENLSVSAFQRAVEYEQLYLLAQKRKVKASNSQFKAQLPAYYQAFQVQNLNELKQALRDRGVSYKDFKQRAKKNLMIQMVYQELQNEVAATDVDLTHVKTEIQLSHIVLPFTPLEGEDEKEAKKRVKALASTVYARLQNGEDFAALAKELSSENANQGGRLGTLKWGQLPLSIEPIAFDLNPGEISSPLELHNRMVILKVTAKKPLDHVFEQDDAALKNQLTQSKQLRHIQENLEQYGKWNEFSILDKRLAPIIDKSQGNLTDAINGYKLLISQSPSNPVPYYLLGNLQASLGMTKDAQDNWEKGVILADASPDLKLPILYLKLGELYRKQQKLSLMRTQFQKAIANVNDDLSLAEHTSSFFKSIKAPSYAQKVDRRIVTLKKEKAEQERRLKAAQEGGLLDAPSEAETKLELN